MKLAKLGEKEREFILNIIEHVKREPGFISELCHKGRADIDYEFFYGENNWIDKRKSLKITIKSQEVGIPYVSESFYVTLTTYSDSGIHDGMRYYNEQSTCILSEDQEFIDLLMKLTAEQRYKKIRDEYVKEKVKGEKKKWWHQRLF